MNSTSTGINIKYTLPFNTHISFVSAVSSVIAGRNTGQATSFTLGCFYANSFASKAKTSSTKNNRMKKILVVTISTLLIIAFPFFIHVIKM